jgi:hypothetical protein
MDVEGSGRGVIQDTITVFTWETEENHEKLWVTGLQADI